MNVLTTLTVVIISQYQIIIPYTLTLHNVIRWLYLNKAGVGEEDWVWIIKGKNTEAVDEYSFDASLMKSRLGEPNVFSQQIFIKHLLCAKQCKPGTGNVIVNKKKWMMQQSFLSEAAWKKL